MDVIFRGGQVIDGTGARAIRADVGIEGDTITALGDLSSAQASRIVDVTGLAVAPGFIDMHSHSDRTLPVDPTADSMVRQGVTTHVIGMCGGTAAPVPARNKQEFDQAWQAGSQYPLRRPDLYWSTFAQYLDVLKDGGLILNAIPLVGHGTIRSMVMGARHESPMPTDEEMSSMRALVASCMRDGAWGMSTGLIYVPGIYSTTEELIDLSRIVAEHGGFYFSHIRGDGQTLLDSVGEAIAIGRGAKLPVQIAHFKATGQSHWPKMGPALRLVEQALDEGLDVTADIYPYLGSSTNLSARTLPLWARAGGLLGILAKPLDRETRQRLVAEMEANISANGMRWNDIYVSRCVERPDYEGKTIAQLADIKGMDPTETALAVHQEGQGRVSAIYMLMSEDNLQMGLSHPALAIGTDGYDLKTSGPLGVGKLHPRSYGTFPRVLGHYARELGLFSMEAAVNKMTGLPAKKLGLSDRGRLAVGLKADVTVFNPDTVIDTATYAEPYSYPRGIEHVMVNGQFVVQSGKPAERFPGRILSR